MTITTKYDINQEVFLIEGDEILKGKVCRITLMAKSDGDMIINCTAYAMLYAIQTNSGIYFGISEENIFETKKEAVREMIRQTGYKISEDDLIEI